MSCFAQLVIIGKTELLTWGGFNTHTRRTFFPSLAETY